MGYDIFGRRPSRSEGRLFLANEARWQPLVKLLDSLCPAETAGCDGWLYNDGAGLDADGAARLARRLEALQATGEVDKYCREQNARYRAFNGPGKALTEEDASAMFRRHFERLGLDDAEIRDRLRALKGADFPATQLSDLSGVEVALEPPEIGEEEIGQVARAIFSIRPKTPADVDDSAPVRPETVEDFRQFLAASGGFSIY
jgi:hypothetical protein